MSRQPSFAEGIRLDGYAAGAAMGAVAPSAEPGVRAGQDAAQPFSEVTAAIHRILDELPVPEEAKPALRHSAVKPLTLAELEADKSPEDALDEVVAASPLLEEPTLASAPDGTTVTVSPTVAEEASAQPDSQPAARPAAQPAPVRRRRTNLLTRRYRITHFWPRSWVRTVRRARAARALRLETAGGELVAA